MFRHDMKDFFNPNWNLGGAEFRAPIWHPVDFLIYKNIFLFFVRTNNLLLLQILLYILSVRVQALHPFIHFKLTWWE